MLNDFFFRGCFGPGTFCDCSRLTFSLPLVLEPWEARSGPRGLLVLAHLAASFACLRDRAPTS